MKQLIFLLLFPAAIFAQAPDYEYSITGNQDGTVTVEKCDLSNITQDGVPCTKWTVADTAQALTRLYLDKESGLNRKGQRIAHTFIDDQAIGRVEAAIAALGGNYATWSQAAANAQSTFSGIYQYTVIGTPTNVEVRIEGLNVLNNANNNQLGTLTGDLSRQWMNVQTAGGTVTLTSFGNNLFVGRNGNGQVVVLRKTGEIAQEP